MNSQERIIKTINHEEADRIPSFEGSFDNSEVIRYYNQSTRSEKMAGIAKLLKYLSLNSDYLMTKIMNKIAAGKRGAEIVVKTTIELYKAIGLDMVPACPLANLPYKYNKKGYINEFGNRMEYKVNPIDNTPFLYYTGGVLEDFDTYESFHQPDPDNPIRENFFKAAKHYQKLNDGKVYITPEIVGVMEVSWEGFGLENFSRLLVQRKKMKKVFDDRGKFAVEMIKRIIEWGEETGPVMVYDDYAYKGGLFMSPRNYEYFVFPWLKKICDTAHKGGLKVMLHSCGDLYPIFQDIINAGVDALNPIEPTTANPDYDIFNLNKKFGDKITFVGNVSPQDLADKDPEYIKSYTKRLIDELGPNGGFILASGHSINPAVKLENYLVMRETLQKYGSYT